MQKTENIDEMVAWPVCSNRCYPIPASIYFINNTAFHSEPNEPFQQMSLAMLL